MKKNEIIEQVDFVSTLPTGSKKLWWFTKNTELLRRSGIVTPIALCRENGIEVHAQGKKMACCVYYDDNGFKDDSRISERLVECKQDGER